MSAQSSGQTLQTSSPSRLSASSSSKDGSPFPNGHLHPGTSDNLKVRRFNDHTFGENSEASQAQDELPQSKPRPRSSGGFLLHELPTRTPRPQSASYTESDVSDNVRGKSKVEDGDLVVPKRANTRQRHRQKPSLGSSPLATKVSNAQSSDQVRALGQEHISNGSITAKNVCSSLSSNEASSASAPSMDEPHHDKRMSAVEHDIDPTQIVNLALSLSESRRRNFSSGGFHAPRDSHGTKRLISPGHPPLNVPSSTAGGSLKQYLNQQRRISRNLSPRSGRSLSSKGASPALSQRAHDEKRSTAIPDFSAGIDEDSVFEASDATLARAERARIAIELSYEYRRLLQWLPKLPTPSQTRPSSNKGLGRVYNPLQYVRNRKVRFKQDRPLDSEAQGWTDINSVRDWINMISDEWEDDITHTDRQLPLPPYNSSEIGIALADGQLSSEIPSSQARKIARPHTVWEFAPWDLLADAYWLDQDDNIFHTEDPHGKKLIHDRRLHQEDRPRTSKDSMRDPIRHSTNLIKPSRSPEKLRASFESLRSETKERDRRGRKVHVPGLSDDNEPQSRRTRWSRKFARSRSPSSSDESYRSKRRGHKRGLGHLGSRDDYDHAALEKHMMDILAREVEDGRTAATGTSDQVVKEDVPDESMIDGNRVNGQVKEVNRRRPNAPQRMHTDIPSPKGHQISARPSLDEQRLQHHRMSSDDFDSTAPNSPIGTDFVPSIAINLSPPASPPTSASSPKKLLPAKLSSFRRARSPYASQRTLSDDDSALESGTSTDISRQTTTESQLVSMLRRERATDPSNGLLSASKSDFFAKGSKPLGTNSIRSIRDTHPSDSKLRGLFKGGRIAEIVGSEVSRVGDKFWRKDHSDNTLQANSPTSSTFAFEDSDIDEEDTSGLDNSPEDIQPRAAGYANDRGRVSQSSAESEKPKFYMDNLPSFRSTLDKTGQPESTKISQDHDHITRQQMELRERGRPRRFDRLAPPKIDMRSVSPSPSRTASPDGEEDRSRNSSSSRSGIRLNKSDNKLNELLNIPGRAGTGKLGPSGLSALASQQPKSRGRSAPGDKRQWSISDRGVSVVRGTITKRDIARIRALLLSSGVKANEIARRAEQTPTHPSPLLRELQHLLPNGVPLLPRSQEYIFAGRTLVNNVEKTAQHLRDAAEQFSHNHVENLRDRIKTVDDHVNYKLTPLVRVAADDADAFSTELTTTHTLAVKQLNDSVDIILRRRRRRLRWIRRAGWAMLEWTLLSIMWLCWFVVVLIRLIRSIIGGFFIALRWLFWL